MTDELKTKLRNHVTWNKPISNYIHGGKSHVLDDGDIINFTNRKQTSRNSEYQLNNSSISYIWHTQLTDAFFDEDFQIYQGLITINGIQKGLRIDYRDDNKFWNDVKYKTFKVSVVGSYYILNLDSKTADKEHLYTDKDMYLFAKKCIEENNIDKIGDILKYGKCYNLTQI